MRVQLPGTGRLAQVPAEVWQVAGPPGNGALLLRRLLAPGACPCLLPARGSLRWWQPGGLAADHGSLGFG